MKNISIKFFTIIALLLLLANGSYIFYNFFQDSKNTTATLLEENIQVNLLNLKHFLDKNLKTNNINQLTAYLDNIVHSNTLISDIHIINDEKKLLYATDRDETLFHKGIECTPLTDIIHTDIFNEECYSFSVKLYNGLTPYYYTTDVYLNKEYLDSLMKDKILKYTTLFVLSFVFFMFLLWAIINMLVVKPLELLRQFAYYSTKVPQQFFIQELESIRYSLDLTFKRLKDEQRELFNISTKDPLSGLYNRLSLMEKINWLISKGKRSNAQFALLFLDLDNFKNINDSRGHEFGDEVLQHVAKVLLSSVRDNDIVSRIGGDEFVIVLPDLQDNEAILEVIHRIQELLNKPIVIDNYKYNVTCSIGITIYPKDGQDVTALLKNADIAMYKSKDLGKNNFHFFTEKLNDEIQEKIHLQRLMSSALEEGHFHLYYQPKVDIKSNKIVGCEALIRLIDPIHGLIPPDKFIYLAEENNFIIPLGEWIIEEATRQLKSWENTPLQDLRLAINISGVQFKDKQLIPTLQDAIGKIDKNKLEIELTESVLMTDFDDKLDIIKKFKDLGLRLSLDDFGTGYSSLSYLKKIPFDTLKIDKSFIDDLQNKKDQSFVNMIVTIADELELDVVAEGVENKEQLEYLKRMKCEQYQGYYCSKPLPAKEFEALFLDHTCH
ncbi:putative bifunctional diguanylate cyclase/phosphodiesterase [Sulfurimonas paralvinellae]|uniref:EAL domain-containing protein n=1 Tax=Sulfurimonas paralvinellae TaxID=317658 RepID=A0A7M1B918_9BACT|nr:EAL domain-containing protein [Sulfurimonas paralvinellae]QOP45916.1 EAL domain-containing protein [Sulfurimonas paralvinellae]